MSGAIRGGRKQAGGRVERGVELPPPVDEGAAAVHSNARRLVRAHRFERCTGRGMVDSRRGASPSSAWVEAHDRQRLEQLCRYITRPALSDERVQLNAAGQVELKVKKP